MSTFIQLHFLTSYPPSNLNRDDLGRPKTAVMGGSNRLRISSQSLKRAWRTSDIFHSQVGEYIGKRTKMMGVEAYKALIEKGVAEKNAREWAKQIAGVFGECKAGKKKDTESLEGLEIKQLAHFSPAEEQAIFDLVDRLAMTNPPSPPSTDDLKLLMKDHASVDISMFGRMLASAPSFNTEAAIQVAHAITVNEVAVEDDFFTAVDDLNVGAEDTGAAHIGENEFAAGLFYLYVCIDKNLLTKNLQGDQDLAERSIAALIETAAKVSPTGKQNSYASRAYASYILAEKGNQQPRSLSVAFLKPVGRSKDILETAIETLQKKQSNMNECYGACADATMDMNVHAGTGTLKDIIDFIKG